MPLSLYSNVASLNAQRHLWGVQQDVGVHMQRLASGLRINKAADDPARLAVSESMRAQVRSLAQARRNANDAVGMLQTGEGALQEVSNILGRMRELAVQAASDGIDATQRGFLNDEFQALSDEITRIANVTEYNGSALLNAATTFTYQVGIENSVDNRITWTTVDMRDTAIGSGAGSQVSDAAVDTVANAQAALAILDNGITDVSDFRAEIGARQSRLQHASASLAATHENLSAAESGLRDADIAEESAAFTRSQILQQAGVSVLAQANQLPSLALALLR